MPSKAPTAPVISAPATSFLSLSHPESEERDPKDVRQMVVAKSVAAKASSAHSRINIPFNLHNWDAISEINPEAAACAIWFHQHILEMGLDWKAATEAIGYSQSTVFRVLKGTYEGDWAEVSRRIDSYRAIQSDRVALKHAEFRETPVTKLIGGGLSYALANNSITLITGESRVGKTETAKWWRDRHNHGRTVLVTAPVYGSARALLRELAACLGINRNTGITNMHEAILRAFNRNRMLIVDEAHRLLPRDRRTDPVMVEILRDIHDRTGCGLAMLATQRFSDTITKLDYQFEQILGRIGMPVRIPHDLTWEDINPIVSQYLPAIPKDLQAEFLAIANTHGRLGILCETLKFANRIASKSNRALDPEIVRQAIAARQQMMGQLHYAKK